MHFIFNGIQIVFIWFWTLLNATLGLVLLPFLGQKRAIYAVSQFWSTFILFISGVKLRVIGLENVDKSKNVIFTANHESSFDIPVLFKVLPVPLFFLVKSELKKIPVFGWFVSAVGMVFVDRKNHSNAMLSLQKAGEEIRKGKSIISFPEGTRTRDGKMKLFKRGSFILALENDIDIIPVGISGSYEVNPPGYLIKPGVITVIIGSPIQMKAFDVNEPDTLAMHVENKVKDLIEKSKL